MVVRFNFGTVDSFVPEGYILDFGQRYGAGRGYGWITEDSVGTGNEFPIRIVEFGRNRDLVSEQVLDTFMHMDYPADNLPNVFAVPVAWEYDLDPGTYEVTVSVGEPNPNFLDSSHVINLEGEEVLSFTPTEDELFAATTETVSVEDGKLTVTSEGGENTKINYIEIEPVTEVRFNFGTEDSFVPEGYILDFGQRYAVERGYGWISEESVGTGNEFPVRITQFGRNRDLVSEQVLDTFIHMDYPEEFQPALFKIPSAWEYELPNGVYEVTVSVGDAAFTDSNHVINLEGENALAFTPTEDNLFASATEIVRVDDGKLTVDSIGGDNTKINYVEIAEVNEVRVNFGSSDAFIPNGHILDFGREYNAERGYGWITEDSLGTGNEFPLDNTAFGRERGLFTGRRDSFIHMDYPAEDRPNIFAVPSAWEYDLPNGTYEVTVSVGDPGIPDEIFLDSNHVINLEGEEFLSFTPREDSLFIANTEIVRVSDGKLSVDSIGGENTKINYIEIAEVDEIRVNFGSSESTVPDGYLLDFGEAYDADRGYGWITQGSVDTGNEFPVENQFGRTRGLESDELLDSFVHMDYSTQAGPNIFAVPSAWEYELEDGFYEVTVGVGDAEFTDSTHVVNIEDVEVISEFTPTSDELFRVGSQVVNVNDGKLTIDAIGGTNTKINYVEIESLLPGGFGSIPGDV